jgi:hypothetical protein
MVVTKNLFRGIRLETAEEQLAFYFRGKGPFVAIGRPGDKIVPGGAARVYVGHDEWQAKVAELIPRCQVVLLQPEETEGIWWEIMHIVKASRPESVLMCLVNYSGNQQRYEELRIRFEAETGIVLPRMIGRYLFLYFKPGWAPRMLEARYFSEYLWPWKGQAIDLEKTLASFFTHEDPPAFSERDCRFVGHGGRAILLYLAMGLLLLGAVGAIIVFLLLKPHS